MLVRTSSGNTSVGHLSLSPLGFSALHRPDFTFQCQALLFPVHSVLLSASSKFFTEFFTYIRGQKAPEVISLDAVKCEALAAVSLGYYLEFVYSGGVLPAFDTVPDAVQALRLSGFFGSASLAAQLGASLAARLPGLGEEELLEVFRAAVDLKLRRLLTECLVQLLPQFGRCTADTTVAAMIEHMDATCAKAVLAQLALHSFPVPGAAALAAVPPASCGPLAAAAAASASDGASGQQPPGPGPAGPVRGITTPGRQDSGEFAAAAAAAATGPAAALDLEQVKQQFVRVLEAKGWGQ